MNYHAQHYIQSNSIITYTSYVLHLSLSILIYLLAHIFFYLQPQLKNINSVDGTTEEPSNIFFHRDSYYTTYSAVTTTKNIGIVSTAVLVVLSIHIFLGKCLPNHFFCNLLILHSPSPAHATNTPQSLIQRGSMYCFRSMLINQIVHHRSRIQHIHQGSIHVNSIRHIFLYNMFISVLSTHYYHLDYI